jgi:glycine/D-amino acid oxidase-like deaminating enzyme
MYDYLIIGHGLAGAVLSQRLLDGGRTIMVLDQPENNNSSLVAAGIYNPITGRKMHKTWRADELFPELISYYQDLEKKLGQQFLHDIGVYRPYAALEDQNDWEAKKSDEKFKPFIDKTSQSNHAAHKLNDPFGGLHLKQAGYLNIPVFLSANKKQLIDKGMYRETMFSEEEIKIEKEGFSYGNQKFKRIIFCNGEKAAQSSLFSWLPFTLVKGEVLDIEMEKTPSTIYNRGVFVLPLEDKSVRVGATYQREYDTLEVSESGIEELERKLGGLIDEKYNIVNARAGIRPATKDRRPFIGKHPNNEHIYIFNGFGSKGVSLIPYFSKMLVQHLLDEQPLDSDTDITRYAALYPTNSLT